MYDVYLVYDLDHTEHFGASEQIVGIVTGETAPYGFRACKNKAHSISGQRS